MAAAELEAAKNSWQVAILDSGGNMVMFHKLDNTQLASIGVSEGKANTALRFKRPSKALDDVIAAGGAGLRLRDPDAGNLHVRTKLPAPIRLYRSARPCSTLCRLLLLPVSAFACILADCARCTAGPVAF